MSGTITIGTHEQAVRATAIVSKRPVIGCPNPADAASPVTEYRGEYSRPIGQSADWRHRIEDAATAGDEVVCTYYREGRWEHSTTADAGRVTEVVRDMIRADERRDARERQQAQERADAKRQQDIRDFVARIKSRAAADLRCPVEDVMIDCGIGGLPRDLGRIEARDRVSGRTEVYHAVQQ